MKLVFKGKKSKLSIVFCGDFNSVPGSLVFKHLTGQVNNNNETRDFGKYSHSCSSTRFIKTNL